jgi:4-oxalocrotonate tautomerase
VGDVVYTAMVEILKAPKDDRFQVIAEHVEVNFIYDPNFFGIARSKDLIFVQLTLADGRTLEQTRGFYKRVVDDLHDRLGVRKEDVSSASLELSARTGPLETARRPSRPRPPRPPGSARTRKP